MLVFVYRRFSFIYIQALKRTKIIIPKWFTKIELGMKIHIRLALAEANLKPRQEPKEDTAEQPDKPSTSQQPNKTAP